MNNKKKRGGIQDTHPTPSEVFEHSQEQSYQAHVAVYDQELKERSTPKITKPVGKKTRTASRKKVPKSLREKYSQVCDIYVRKARKKFEDQNIEVR